MTEAAAGYRRIEEFLARFDNVELGQWTEGFEKAMNDDFSVPKALAEIHVAVREGNKALSASDEQTAQKLAESVRRMAEILGFDPLSNQWGAGESDDSAALEALDVLVQAELARRAQARAEKNWAVADEVRDRLAEAGITVTDSADGAKWSLN